METLDYHTARQAGTTLVSRRQLQFPHDDQHAGERAARRDRKGQRRAQRLPCVAAREAARGTADAEREAAVYRLAARLVTSAKKLMHDSNRRRMKGAESRRVQRLGKKHQQEAVRAPTD